MEGYYWHVHHDILVEYCYDYDERKTIILKCKPANERGLTLKLLQPVKGKLPQAYDEAGKAYYEARKAYYEARKACNETGKAYYEARKACNETAQAYDEALKACNETAQAYDEAGKAYYEALEACNEEIMALHDKECPNCPWDGKTIFPKSENISCL